MCFLRVADDAIHLAAYFGDTSGNGIVPTPPDTTLIRRLIGQVQTGLAAYPLADPMLIAHVKSYWVTRANRHDSYSPRYRANPGRRNPATSTETTTKVYIPTDLTGHPGNTITGPVKLEVADTGGITISDAAHHNPL